jgi:hypothetical protein
VKSSAFFLPEKVLARGFRQRFKLALQQKNSVLAAQVPAAAWRKDWVVDCVAVGSGESALKYLSAYVYRTALSSTKRV